MPTDIVQHFAKSIGVNLLSFLIVGGLFVWLAPASVMPIASAYTATIVLAVLIATVLSTLIKVPLMGTAVGAFFGSVFAIYFLSLLAPIDFTFGFGFAFFAMILNVVFDWVAHALMK